MSRIGAAVGTYLLPLSLTGLGTGPTMLIAAGTTALGLLVCVLWAEETRGTALGAAPAAGRTGTAKTSAVPAQRVPQTARG